ncbi:thiamine phosphate synthase [Hydrogenimonas cancrithermarum]|uniref:Thiamine phosphate synthase/TenI domain-containing protein n=1 Tax=Hydrogenimonas cancrithermarum TaxID=2993563 RepID=A0ABN6WTB8_9BACT|nr:thiamine phosphate synthase [Hydrogenimonas cancrithermarum]BDY12321.1 hypothetical protein HCR_06330 [Hydrogenimonas cancrithermarum]
MRVYALLDESSLQAHGWSVERFVRRAIAAGADIIQYRNKSGDIGSIEKRLRTIASLFDGRLIVNDHPELAYLCEGVHIGQEDLRRYGANPKEAVATLREILGQNRWIGLSTHNEEEIATANRLELDYIGLGACRTTSTKSDANVLGCEKISEMAASSRHPVAAIGGVRLDDYLPNVTWLVVGSALYED